MDMLHNQKAEATEPWGARGHLKILADQFNPTPTRGGGGGTDYYLPPSPRIFILSADSEKVLFSLKKRSGFNKSRVNHLRKLLHHHVNKRKNYAPTNTYVLLGFFLSHIIK